MQAPTDAYALLVASVAVGLTAAGAIQVIRALPLVRSWVMRGTKPWACDLCMSWWLSLAAGAVGVVGSGPEWGCTVLPAVAVSMWVTGRMKPVPDAGAMPELEDTEGS